MSDIIFRQKNINKKRIAFNQDIGWLFRPLALCPFPARPLGKRKVLGVKDNKVEEIRDIVWKRKAGNISVEILGHPEYGVPYGQDILIVLFLANEARKQNSRKIQVNFYRDFCRMFEINPNDGRRYRNVINSLNRIRHSQFTWTDNNDQSRQKGLHYIYIEEVDLFCDPKNPDQKPLYDQYILLSERFWDEINNYKIPLNLDAVRFLKAKTSNLNFYLWLSYRVAITYLKNKTLIDNSKSKGIEFIPFWGENGLIDQLSTQISKRHEFRREIKKWLKNTYEIWPKCPVKLDGDAIKITVSNSSQLDIQLDKNIELGRAIRQDKVLETITLCPICKSGIKFFKGKKQDDGRTWDNYYRCQNCERNFSKNKYPELFPVD